MRALPVVISRENKALVGAVTLAILIGTYSITNGLRLVIPIELRPTRIDDLVPLSAPTLWIYASYPALFVSAWIREKDPFQLTRYFYADIAANVVSEAIFLVWPTTFARPPLPKDADVFSTFALATLWSNDAPVNCFPSLHVSTTLLPTFMLFRNHRRVFWLYVVWAAGILLSTMSTKQHHFYDVLGGIVVAAVMYWLFFVRATYATPAVAPAEAR